MQHLPESEKRTWDQWVTVLSNLSLTTVKDIQCCLWCKSGPTRVTTSWCASVWWDLAPAAAHPWSSPSVLKWASRVTYSGRGVKQFWHILQWVSSFWHQLKECFYSPPSSNSNSDCIDVMTAPPGMRLRRLRESTQLISIPAKSLGVMTSANVHSSHSCSHIHLSF